MIKIEMLRRRIKIILVNYHLHKSMKNAIAVESQVINLQIRDIKIRTKVNGG